MFIRKPISENSDATTTYDIIYNYPIKFEDLFMDVLEKDKSFNIEFRIRNEEFEEYCFGNEVSTSQDMKTKERFFANRDSKHLYNNIKGILVKECWANGGWGRMTYYVTF